MFQERREYIAHRVDLKGTVRQATRKAHSECCGSGTTGGDKQEKQANKNQSKRDNILLQIVAICSCSVLVSLILHSMFLKI